MMPPGGTVAIVPVKDLASAKTRLAPHLSPAERSALVRQLLEHVLGVLAAAPEIDRTIVVSPEPAILELAGELGAVGVPDLTPSPPSLPGKGDRTVQRSVGCSLTGVTKQPSSGRPLPSSPFPGREGSGGVRSGTPTAHNRALETARGFALQWQPGALLVVSADLPRLGVGDLEGMLALGRSAGTVVIAPDRGGAGTNALLLRPAAAIPFCFGLGSRARHAAEANERGYRVAVYEAEGTALDVDVPADLCLLEGARYASRP